MKRLLYMTTALTLAAPAFADGEMRYRLIVADAQAALVTVADIGTADTTSTSLEMSSPARVYLGPDGRHAWAVQRAAGLVQMIDTGLIEEDHGDHSALVLQTPALLPATASGDTPVHFNMGGDQVAIFWDGTGTATRHAATGDLATLASFETGGPHHGLAVPVGDMTIVTVAPEGEGLPDALAMIGPDGAELGRIDCLNLHGEGKVGPFIAFGCEDGIAIFDRSSTPPAARFVSYPADAPEGGTVRSLLSPRDTLALIGNFGADHLVIFDPSAETGDFVLTPLPAPRVAFALDDTGQIGVALLADGRLIRFSALTGRILGEATGVTGPYSMERGVVRPMVAVAGDRIAVSDPAMGQVALVDPETLDLVDRVEVGGQPQSLLLLAADAEHDH